MTDNLAQTRRPATVRIARWSALHPWRAIALWLVFVAACIAIGQVSGLRTVSDLDTGVGQSGHAARVMHDAHVEDPATEDVLITSRTSTFDGASARQAAAAVTGRLRALPEVASVAAPVPSANGKALLVEATMNGDPDTAQDRVSTLLKATAATQQDYPALRIEEAGGASLGNAVNDEVASDLGAAAEYSIPVTLIILLLAFGAIIAAGVPLLLALSAVGSATGLAAVASHFVPDSGSTSSMILLMGMAVGVDYSLFYVKRVREELARGRTHIDAIDVAAETSGHSVMVSGVAVIVAMLGLFVARDVVFASLAAGSIIVVAIAVLGSLTVLPAVLAKLGRHIDRPRVPFVWRLTAKRAGHEPRLWAALLRPSIRYPGRTLAVSVLLLLALAAPALGLRLHSDSPQSLPQSIPAVQTFDRLAAAFPGEQSTQEVVVKAPAADAAQVNSQLQALRARLAGNPLFASDPEPVVTSADGTVHVLYVKAPFDAESARAKAGLTALRSELVPQTVGTVSGAQWSVGGDTATAVDYDKHLSAAIPWVVGFVVVMTMLMIGAVFRSLVLAMVTAFVNLLSAGAAFGVLALTFQRTWAQSLLDFHSTGAVITWIPLFTFAVLFGLSMDYHVFVISRIREAAASGLSTRDAVRQGILRSAGTVTSAAIVMVSVFAIFASLHMVEMKELGVGLAVAVLIDAVLVRAVVLPSLLVLLGRFTWWPSDPSAPSAPSDPSRIRVTQLAGSPEPLAVAGAPELASAGQRRDRVGVTSAVPSRLRFRNPVSLLFSGAPWACAAYLFSYVVVGGAGFAITLAVVVVGGVLSPLWLGLPLLYAGFGVVRAVAAVERGRGRMVGIRLVPEYRRVSGRGLRRSLRARLTDSARWWDVVVLVAMWPVLLVLDLTALVLWLIPLALISMVFWHRYVPQTFDNGTTGHGIQLGYYPDGPHGATRYGWFIDSTQSALIAAGVGLVLLVLLSNYLVVGAARLHLRAIAPRRRAAPGRSSVPAEAMPTGTMPTGTMPTGTMPAERLPAENGTFVVV
jgi:RND superfamily putative drug exporter